MVAGVEITTEIMQPVELWVSDGTPHIVTVPVPESWLWTGHYRVPMYDEDPSRAVEALTDADLIIFVRCADHVLRQTEFPEFERHPVHTNTPMGRWAFAALPNWLLLYELYDAAVREVSFRDLFISQSFIRYSGQVNAAHHVPGGTFTVASPPPIQVPREYVSRIEARQWINVISSNRQFYCLERDGEWTARLPPQWWLEWRYNMDGWTADVAAWRQIPPRVKPFTRPDIPV